MHLHAATQLFLLLPCAHVELTYRSLLVRCLRIVGIFWCFAYLSSFDPQMLSSVCRGFCLLGGPLTSPMLLLS